MNHSLASLATAMGVDQGAYQVAGYGGGPTPQLRLMGQLFTNLDAGSRRSLRTLADELPNLPALALSGAVENVEVTPGLAVVTVRVDASPGAVWWTTIETVLNDGPTFVIENFAGDQPGAAHTTTTNLGPGTNVLRLRRAGLASTGVWQQSVTLKTVLVPVVPPVPPPLPPPVVRPHIDVTHTLDGVNASFVLTGSGFLPNQPNNAAGITIQAVESATLHAWVQVWTGSDGAGQVRTSMGPLDVSTLPMNAAGQRQVTFTATDSRKDPHSVPANAPLWSNAVVVTF